MNKLIGISLAALLACGVLDASAQSNPAPASWQGPRTAGHGVGYCNTGMGITIQDPAISGCGVLSYGAPLYPIYQQSILAAVTFTNGSTSFATAPGLAINVPNGTNVPGDTMYQTNAPTLPLCGAGGFRSSVVTYTPSSGAGTMTCPAGANSTENVRFGDGIRFDAGSSTLGNTLAAQNVKIGDAAQYRTWWPTNNPGYAGNLVNQGASLELGTNNGGIIAAMLAAHSADAVSSNTIALDIHTLADATSLSGSTAHGIWGIYEQIDTVGTTAATNRSTTAGEIEIANHWPVVTIDPFSGGTGSLTVDMSFGSGAGEPTTGSLWGTLNPATAAIWIIPNNSTFESGIVFGNGALDKTQAGGFAPALALGNSESVSFYKSAGVYGWNIYENSTNSFVIADATNAVNVVSVLASGLSTFGETGALTTVQGSAVILSTAGGREVQVNNVATPVNWIGMAGSGAGIPVSITAAGTDTDIDLQLNPKGAGVLRTGANRGVTCAAGTVSTATMVVSLGLVTHC